MSEKFPSLPDIEALESAPEGTIEEKRSVELFCMMAGLDGHPDIPFPRYQEIKGYLLTRNGSWRRTDGKKVLPTDVKVEVDRILVTVEDNGLETVEEIPR